ncbi:MAG TPA: D-alanyl-D-alanine carboxypeptidase [Pyrinomonadaceae bacterium]|jgi:D-alanyl-D-alanine carboxypeptidase/D-alanyl-D-alanine-endopeptidase (penicillin-binding protein 4)
MQGVSNRFFLALSAVVILAAGPVSVLAQTSQTNQQTNQTSPPPPLTRPTILSWPNPAQPAPSTTTTQPDVLLPQPSDTPQPTYLTPITGAQGLLVETLDGKTLYAQSADEAFNPASAVKLATALDALHTFGPQHRFITAVWTDGTFDKTSGTITGNLIISGRDPSLHYEHAVMIAQELNRQGIRTVTGDLIIAPGFTMNFDWSARRSGEQFYDTLDATRRPTAAARAWDQARTMMGQAQASQGEPSVAVMGAVYVNSVPANARMLLVHRSSKLVDVLKVLLCYSNNFMAERIGDTLGGPQGLRRFLIDKVGLSPSDVSFASTSGLGVNRVTPRAMMKIYRALSDELGKHQLEPSDILPVAGIDPGTLEKRYQSSPSRGSVIAKTGTLIRTDGGASALVGQMRTRSGETLLFVIFNQRGSVWRFRQNQDFLVSQIQSSRGGPAPFNYQPTTLAMRLSDTERDAARPASADEYEPGDN